MIPKDVLASIDAEIASLKEARALLKGSGKPAKIPSAQKNGRRKHAMSAEGRKRIAEAQRKRWAALKMTKAKTV
jgi:hypothetical protein